MDGHQCSHCRKYWASGAGEPDRFEFITKLCPDCISNTRILELEPLTGPSWQGFRPGGLPGERTG